MADDVDRANDYIERELDKLVQQAGKEIPVGRPGECDLCGEWSGRLIKGACAPCRDRYLGGE